MEPEPTRASDGYLAPVPRPDSVQTQGSSQYAEPYQYPGNKKVSDGYLNPVPEHQNRDMRPGSAMTQASSVYAEIEPDTNEYIEIDERNF